MTNRKLFVRSLSCILALTTAVACSSTSEPTADDSSSALVATTVAVDSCPADLAPAETDADWGDDALVDVEGPIADVSATPVPVPVPAAAAGEAGAGIHPMADKKPPPPPAPVDCACTGDNDVRPTGGSCPADVPVKMHHVVKCTAVVPPAKGNWEPDPNPNKERWQCGPSSPHSPCVPTAANGGDASHTHTDKKHWNLVPGKNGGKGCCKYTYLHDKRPVCDK